MIAVVLKKSLIGRHKSHIATAYSLGLRRVGDTRQLQNTPANRGKLARIHYLVTVKE